VEEAVPAVQVAPVARVAPVTQPAPSVPEVPVHPRPPVTAPPPGGLVLRLETERGPRSTFEVTKSGATIGRGPESTIQLPDLSVSRKHAQIAYKQGEYWLSDLGSMGDRKSTRLNSSHLVISYAVFCLKKKIHMHS